MYFIILIIIILYLLYKKNNIYEKFTNINKIHNEMKNSEYSTNAMVIVEPRKHKLLKDVISNFDSMMDSSWDLYVFYGKSFLEFAKDTTKDIIKRRVKLLQLDTDNLSVNNYNKLFKQKSFWDKVKAENILVFQTDTILCKNSKYKIDDFINYNYIGCPYDNKIIGTNSKIWDKYNMYGIGGLSFRKKSFMLKCIDNNPNIPDNFAEDVFYSECLQNNKPDIIKLNKFCTQHKYFDNSFGLHKPTNLKNNKELHSYCPEIKILE
jgi:hypothetical protein